MSNKPRTRRYKPRVASIASDSPLRRIAEHTGEDPRDVQAAFVALRHDGYTFDEVWEMARHAINDGKNMVDMAAENLRE